jgi:hypothetical protein
MQDWNTEDGHDGIPDELLHCPAMGLDDPLHALEVAGKKGAQCFRIGGLSQGG